MMVLLKYRKARLNHNSIHREGICKTTGKMLYHVEDKECNYYLFNGSNLAIANGFDWAFKTK